MNDRKRRVIALLLAALMAASLCACGTASAEPAAEEAAAQAGEPAEQSAEPAEEAAPEEAEEIDLAPAPGEEGFAADEEGFIDEVDMSTIDIENEAVALAASPEAAVPAGLTVVASGTVTRENDKAVIDYSNITDGYVMVKYKASTNKRLKVQVKGPTTTYTYNLPVSKWTTFPLSDGNGAYQVAVYENVQDTKYSSVLSASFTVKLANEQSPFLRPNQYVDYAAAPNTVAAAAKLVAGKTDVLKKVQAVYEYVVGNLKYDYNLAATVQSGYLPVLDTVLARKSGICFDYAALMAGMLRSQGVPCKLVIGYAGTTYHAWISVWSAETGWVNGAIYFNGSSWKRMDPTFASTGGSSAMKFIENNANYSVKYMY